MLVLCVVVMLPWLGQCASVCINKLYTQRYAWRFAGDGRPATCE